VWGGWAWEETVRAAGLCGKVERGWIERIAEKIEGSIRNVYGWPGLRDNSGVKGDRINKSLRGYRGLSSGN